MGRGFESLRIHFAVGVAQLVRAPDCGSGGRGFESHHSPFVFLSSILLFFVCCCYGFLYCEPLAQVVEHLTFNQVVPGSSPGWLICLCLHLWKKINFCMQGGVWLGVPIPSSS